MSRARLSSIAHSELDFAAPWSESTAADVVAALELDAEDCVVDVGCGWAELLTRIVEQYAVRADGVELSDYAVERARRDTLPRTGGLLLLHHADVASAALPAASYDLVVCIGSTHLYGGAAGTIAEATRLLRRGGALLLGDGIWERPPTAAALAGLEAEPEDLLTLDELQELTRTSGFEVRRSWQSSTAEWDHYEDSWCRTLATWAAAHPDDPDAATAAELAMDHQRGYRQGYRGVLGFVTLLLD